MLPAVGTAIVHGGSGAVGAAVARGFAREGAVVHLTGRTVPALEAVARRIRDDGGSAHVAELDAADRDAVERHAAAVAARHLVRRGSGVAIVEGHGTVPSFVVTGLTRDRRREGRGGSSRVHRTG
jgi:NAD(P)-dependent dehydrogenase (short-subunit alcohol dehydrogenase family)